MKRIEPGGTGLRVSIFCLGGMYFGSKTNAGISDDILNRFTAAGGNFIDTANIYAHWINGCGGGESEEYLGGWLKRNKNRNEIIIATKTGIEYPGVERGLRKEKIKTECEKSLKRLKTEYIDVYYSHADDKSTPLEETLGAFEELRKEGKIRFIGASNYTAARMNEALKISRENKITGFCCIQQRHTYLRPSGDFKLDTQVVADEELMTLCGKTGIQLLAYSPLLSGTYSRPEGEFPQYYRTEKNSKRMKILKEMSAEFGTTINQLVLSWMLNSVPEVIPVIGVSSVKQLDENLKAAELNPGKERIEILNKFFAEK